MTLNKHYLDILDYYDNKITYHKAKKILITHIQSGSLNPIELPDDVWLYYNKETEVFDYNSIGDVKIRKMRPTLTHFNSVPVQPIKEPTGLNYAMRYINESNN